MKFNRNPLSQAINITLCASAAASMVLASGVALAQDEATDEEEGVELDRVLVTGSRIKRVDVEGALPVTVIDREQIELTGESNAADLIRNLTFNSTGSFRPQSGSSAQGVSTVSLRGLGSSRTLVLINGRRMAKAPSTGQSSDLNTIPIAAIERIEVLTDGASAVYGSDALGGVINVITRKDFEGAQLAYGMAEVDPEGGDREEGSVLFGASSSTSSIIAGASWNDRDIVFARDFPWYSPGASVYANNVNFLTSTGGATTSGLAPFPGGCEADTGNQTGTFYTIPLDNAVDGRGQRCAYNFSAVSADEASISNASAFAYMQHEFSDNWNVFSDITATRTNSFGRYAPVPDLGVMDADSPNNPTNPDGNHYDPAFGDNREMVWWHRFDALGNRDNDVETRLDDLLVGVQGFIGNSLEVEAGIRDTANKVYDIGRNYLLNSQAGVHINSGDYDLANPKGADPDVLNSMKVTISRISKYDQQEAYGLVSWDMFETASGPIQWVVGGEFRRENYLDQYDSLSEAGVVGGSAGNSAGAQRDIMSAYFETFIPLGRWELSVAGRHDDYDDYGSDFSPKASVRWQTTDSLTLRASYGEGFRAPTLDVLTSKDAFSADTVVDRQTCEARGLAYPCEEQVNGLRLANPNLLSEQSEQYSVGAAWEPVDWFFTKVDYYNIKIVNSISFISAQRLVNLELAGDSWPERLGLDRDPDTGDILLATQSYENLGEIKQSGFDVNLQFSFDVFAGRLTSNFQTSYITEYDNQDGRSILRDPGVPEYRALLWNNYAIGDFAVAYNINVIGDQCASLEFGECTGPENDDGEVRHVPTWVTHDLQGNWFAPWEGQISVGCQNCGNKQPPIGVGFVGSRAYDFNLYNGFGRIVYARYKQSF